MGMTIAEPIQTLEYLRDSGVFPFSTKEGVLYTVESIEVAIDTMRKYQKIEEIVDKWHNDPRMKMTTSYYYMAKITEVLEDGNNTGSN